MSRIDLQIVGTANFGQIESALTRLRAQLASINSMQMTGFIPASAQQSIDGYLKTFRETIDASGMYQRQLVSITNETEKFGRSLERGNLRLGQLYKTAMDYRRTEIGQIRQLAREQVRMQNAVAISRGDGMAEVFVPRGLDEGIEKTRILSQEYRILRQVVRNGSTELINWGKNTQWAGRQLTVGLTVPITLFGAAAAKAFMDADKQLTRLTKVYGDAAKGMVSATDLQQIRSQATGLAQEIASGMGVSVTETLGIAADIAATGKEGNELLSATREAMRLSVLGEVDRQEAMRATLAIQTVFKQNTEGLTDSINFLNAVENQTSTSLNDLVTGIVKAGPVVQGLGGDIEDLALMMVAMREGGVPASEAANAIKSSLASLINPTKQTTQVLNDFGVDLKNIVDTNAGDVIGTLVGLQGALEGLDELSRQRSIEQIFGKFQFSRINALLNNLNKAGSQTEQVLSLAGLSTSQLAETAQRELAAVTESVTGRFQRAVESLKANLIPIGETFTEIGTILINVGSKILEVFNSLPDPVKNFFKLLTLGTAVIGPIIMITGVLGNFFGYLVKGISTLMLFKKAGRGAFDLLTPESAATMKATELLTESLFDQTVAVDTMASAIDRLINKLEALQVSMQGTSSSTVFADTRVLAGAEAGAMRTAPVATPYSTPDIPFARRRTPSEVTWTAGGTRDIQYSHLTAASRIRNTLGDMGKFEPMGMGSWVEGTTAEVQKGLKNFFADVAVYSEEIMTPEFRREELTRFADKLSSSGTITGEQYSQLITQIKSLSEEQLAQILPSWEKLSLQTSEYMAVLSTAADGIRSENAETKAKVKGALEDYKRDSIDDPVGALKALRQDLTEAGLSVEARAEEISRELDAIRQEALQGYSDPQERQEYLEQQVSKRVIKPYELESFETIGTEVKGFGGRSGYNKIIMATVQQLTDDMMNQSQMSDELLQAYQRSINAKNTLAEAEKAAADAANKSKTASEELAAAEQKAEAALQKAYSKPRDLSTARRNDQGQWEIDGQIIGQKQKELIAALDAREAALRNVEQTEIEGAASQERLIDAQDRNRQTSEMLNDAKEKEIQSKVKNINATDKDTKETLESANSENMQESANKQNVKATQVDTKETLGAATSENLQEIANRRNANVTNKDTTATSGSSSGIMGMLTRGGGRLSGLGAGLGSALSMATMFMPTGDNEALNTATNIIGGAGMGASMGAMAGAPGAIVGGVLGAAIPAVTAYVDAQQKATDELLKYTQALSGASSSMEGFGRELGRRSPTERLTQELMDIKLSQEEIIEAQSILETETGKALLQSAQNMAGPERQQALLNQLKQLTLSEIFTPEEAKAVAAELGTQLGDPMLGQSLVEGIASVLNSEGGLIKDAMSRLFIDSIPTANELMGLGEVELPIELQSPNLSGYAPAAGVYDSEEIYGSMSRLSSVLNQLAEAEAMVNLSFQRGEITRSQYTTQMDDISQRASTALDSLLKLSDLGQINLVGAESVFGDIAALNGITEQYDKIDEVVSNLSIKLLGVNDSLFRISLGAAAAYGQLQVGEVQAFQDLLDSDPEIEATVKTIFAQEGVEESALEIIRMINSGMDPEFVLNVTTKSREIGKPVDALYQSLIAISMLPPDIQKRVMTDLENSPEALSTFIQNYEYVMALPDSNKELKAEIFGNEDFELFQDNWQAFVNLPDEERKRAIFEYMVTGSYDFAVPEAPVPTAVTELASPNISEMLGSLSGGSGSGGSGGDDSVSKAFDKKIKQQDRIIKQIQKEREERQKLLDLERKALDFSMRQQDLESQILIAKSEGRIADAALLQSQLDAERIADREDEKERLRQEEEDRRIKKAEREKKRLEKEKQKATDSSGGGGGGGSDEAEMRRIERSLQFLNDELNAALLNNTDILDQISEKGSDAFWKSEPIKRYTAAAQELGIPLNVINEQLDMVYDELVNKGFSDQGIRQFDKIKDALIEVGISGATLNDVLPDVFGILSNPDIDRKNSIKLIAKAFEDAGDNAEVAEERAKRFLRVSGQRTKFVAIEEFNKQISELTDEILTEDRGRVISTQFAEGVKKGISNKQILDNISNALYDSIYKEGIKKGLDPKVAEENAALASSSIKTKLTNEFDQFSVNINHKAKYDDSELPSFLRDATEAADRGPTGTPTWSYNVNHNVSGDLKLERGNSTSLPLFVHVVNSTSTPGAGPGGDRAYGGYVRRGTGGMIYGPGGPTEDLIPTMLSNGEYVIRASSVDKYGIQLMDMINMGKLDLMAKGGYSKYPGIVSGMARGGGVYYNAGGAVSESTKNIEYNINVSVEGTNSSADEIANKVMSAIERKQSMSRTVNRV